MLLNKPVLRRRSTHIGVTDILDVLYDPAKRGQILVAGLNLAIGIVPNADLRRIERSNRVDIAGFDCAKQPFGNFIGNFGSNVLFHYSGPYDLWQ